MYLAVRSGAGGEGEVDASGPAVPWPGRLKPGEHGRMPGRGSRSARGLGNLRSPFAGALAISATIRNAFQRTECASFLRASRLAGLNTQAGAGDSRIHSGSGHRVHSRMLTHCSGKRGKGTDAARTDCVLQPESGAMPDNSETVSTVTRSEHPSAARTGVLPVDARIVAGIPVDSCGGGQPDLVVNRGAATGVLSLAMPERSLTHRHEPAQLGPPAVMDFGTSMVRLTPRISAFAAGRCALAWRRWETGRSNRAKTELRPGGVPHDYGLASTGQGVPSSRPGAVSTQACEPRDIPSCRGES